MLLLHIYSNLKKELLHLCLDLLTLLGNMQKVEKLSWITDSLLMVLAIIIIIIIFLNTC